MGCDFCIKPKKQHFSCDCKFFKNKKFVSLLLKKIKKSVYIYDIAVEHCVKNNNFTLFKKLFLCYPLWTKYNKESSYIIASTLFYIDKYKTNLFLAKLVSIVHHNRIKYSVVEICSIVGLFEIGL